MKGKRILGLLLAGLLLGSTAQAADITVTVEGRPVPAFVEEGVTYVQLAPFLEHGRPSGTTMPAPPRRRRTCSPWTCPSGAITCWPTDISTG